MICPICQEEVGGGAPQFHIHLRTKRDGQHELSKEEAKKLLVKYFPDDPYIEKL